MEWRNRWRITIRWDRADNSPAGVTVVERVVASPAGLRRLIDRARADPQRGRLPLPTGPRVGRRRAGRVPQRARLRRRLGDHTDAGLVAVPLRREHLKVLEDAGVVSRPAGPQPRPIHASWPASDRTGTW